jgi:hypothetical protein
MAQALERNQIGKRESLADLIAVAESDKTPYLSMVDKRKKPGNVVTSWQVKNYPDDGHGGVRDGVDASDFKTNPRQLLQGVTQKLWFNPAVSDFAEESVIAGVGKGEMAAQVADALKALARKAEKRLLSANDCALEAQPTQANETRGIFSWLSTAAQAQYPVPAAFLPNGNQIYSGTLANFNEAALVSLGKAAYKRRKGPANLTGIVGVDLKSAISTFSRYDDTVANKTNIRRFNMSNDDKALLTIIDRVVLDTGSIDLMLSSFLYTNSADGADTLYTHNSGVFVDMDMAGIAYTRLPRVKELPYAGGGYKAIVDMMIVHMIDNPMGMFSATINS